MKTWIHFRSHWWLMYISAVTAALVPAQSASQRHITVPVQIAAPTNRGGQVRLKQILHPPTSAAISLQSTSTAVFEESFEGTNGFPPTGWKIFDADGGGTTAAWFQGNTSVFTAYSGNGYAAANYQGANDFIIDQWLISPKISSIGANDTLTFWERSPDNSLYNDSVQVRISTTDTVLTSFTVLLDYFKTSTAGWEQKRYPLKNFVSSGSNVFIAFRYLLYDGGVSGMSSDYVGIDLVQILRPQVAADIKAVSIDNPTSGSKQVVGQTSPLEATFKNVGSATQTNIPVRIRIYTPTGEVDESNKTIGSLDADQSVQVTFGNYTASVTGIHTICATALLSGDQNHSNDSTTLTFRGAVLLTGSYSVGSGGTIETLKSAFDSLNNNIIAGDITLSLINQSYTEPPLVLGPLAYSLDVRRVVVQPAAGISPIIGVTGTAEQPFAIELSGVSKVTINGSNSSLGTRNTVFRATGSAVKIGVLVQGISGATADSNAVENLVIQSGADSTSSSSDYYGVLLSGYSSDYPNAGNSVSNCEISRHGATGIAMEWEEGAIVENNFIHDWTQAAGLSDLTGIWLADGSLGAVVRGNVVGNLRNLVNGGWASAIENGAGSGSGARVYNNMIYGILSLGAGSQPNYSRGIYSSNAANSGDEYSFNSVDLTGTDRSTAASSRASGFECAGGSNISVKDNVFLDDVSLSGVSGDNKAFCIYLSLTPANFISNYNDLFAPGTQGAIGFNISNTVSLSSWRHSFSPVQDSLSMSSDPMFIAPDSGNLHIRTDVSSPVNDAGIPITGITTDIDGRVRSITSPDIGAVEFTPGEKTISFEVASGWNLLSVPVACTDRRTAFLFPSAVSHAFAFEHRYISVDTMLNGIGYWLKFHDAHTVQVVGIPIPVDTLDLSAGWNIIGTSSRTVASSAVVQVPEGIVESRFFLYDGSYTPADSLNPGKGYWVKVKQAGKLIISSP